MSSLMFSCCLFVFLVQVIHQAHLEEQKPLEPPEECGYNEVWTQTKVGCPPQTCESQYLQPPCFYSPPYPGCVCIDNHLRNSSGICIPTEQCPPPPTKQCHENEYYEKCALIVCVKQCRDLFVPVGCPSVYPGCFEPACLCKEGYLRNNEGICVPSEKCEANCRENEEFTDCTYSICRPQLCEEKGFTKDCMEVDKEYCRPGCVCKENHLRENGTCIPVDQCKTYPPLDHQPFYFGADAN